MATYNGERYIERALRSALAQTAPPFEIIVVDDGSSDDSVAVARACGATVIPRPHAGVCAARNAGITEASGDFIALMDQDDEWHPTKLERQLDAVARFPSAAMVSTDAELIDDDGQVIQGSLIHAPVQSFAALIASESSDRALFFPDIGEQIHKAGWFLLPSATLIRRAAILRVGMFNERVRLNEDVACFLRILNDDSLVVLDEPLTRWRIHASNTHRNDVGMLRGRLALTREALTNPGNFPRGYVERLDSELAELLTDLGREEARLGNMSAARANFWESVRIQKGLRRIALLALSLGGVRLFEVAVKLNRRIRGFSK